MKSFSPAGMATKAYYGRGARTFGNPGGATSGNGSFNGGGGGGGFVFRQRSVTALQCQDVAFDGASTWIATGGGANNGEIWRSTDGITWALMFTANPVTVQNLNAVAFGGGNWVVWGNDVAGITQVAYRSIDGGLTWNPAGVAGGDNQQARGIAYGGGVFVANGKFNTMSSGDGGQNFGPGGNFPNTSGFGCIRYDGAVFMCANTDSSGCPGLPSAAVSASGDVPFSEQTITGFTINFIIPSDFAWNTTRTLYVSTQGDDIATSPTILPWVGTNRYTIPAGIMTGLAFGAAQFIAPTVNGTIVSSPDGITWTESAPVSGTTGFVRAAFGQGMFVITANDGIWTYGP